MNRFTGAQVLAAVFLAACGGDYPRRKHATGAGGVAFVENAACAECHAKEFGEWRNSHHDRAMQPATSETVLGDFTGVTFSHLGVTSRFFRRGDGFVVHTEGPDGRMADFEVKYTFGVDPLQQYLIAFPGGRLQCLTIAWDTRRKRWYSLYPNERIRADDSLHWTRWSQRWNLMCAECHSTNLRKAYDPDKDVYRTAWDEINVSCQACHGPGDDHVRWARGVPKDYRARPGESKLLVDFQANDSWYQVDQCARCHSRRHQVSPEDRHGDPYMDHFQVATLREGLYHADGQILDEVYVYGSFLQSKMYRRGVRCTDCHDPHTIRLKASGDAICTECHRPDPPARFPTLARKVYNDPSHHFHRPEGAGARCVSCHMIQRTYMVVDPRRDHSFRIPRPDLSVELGTPNACNDCHQDKTPAWAGRWTAKWYGGAAKPHFAPVIALGRRGDPAAPRELGALARDPGQPAIVRATALELLRNYGEEGVPPMLDLLRDEAPLVRTLAVGGLDRLEPAPRLDAVSPLLGDPIRAVRQEAARVLASVPRAMMDARQRMAFDRALEEYRATQRAASDTPGGRFNLGVLEASLGRFDEAQRRYRSAIALDPAFLPAQLNLATLLDQNGRNADAERVLREAIETSPDNGELRYSLGLLLAEESRLEEAARSLELAARLLPGRARVRYNYALALQHLGRAGDTERELLKAHEGDPADPAIVNALVIFYVQQRRLEEARVYATRLAALTPADRHARELLEQIEREMLRREPRE